MKMNMASKISTNIYVPGFLMRNFLKCTQQEFCHCRQQWYPNLSYGFPLNIIYTLQYGESPNVYTEICALTTILLAEFNLDM